MFTNLLARANYVKPTSPIDMSAYGTGGVQVSIMVGGDDNIYSVERNNAKIYTMVGQSNTLYSEREFPVEYPYSAGWRVVSLNWHNRLSALVSRTNEDYQHYVEFEGFSNVLAYDVPVTTIVRRLNLRWLDVDPIRGWIVGVTTRDISGNKDYIVKYQYSDGAWIGHGGRLLPTGNGSYQYGWIDAANHLMYVYREPRLYWFDYTLVDGTDNISSVGSVGDFDNAATRGASIDVAGNFWGANLGYSMIRYNGISNTPFPF